MSVRSIAAVAVLAVGVAALSGCEEEVSGKDMEAYVEDKAKTDTMAQVAKEDTELKEQVAKLKATDPSVKDAYYSVDENGEKQLHVITENKEDPSKVSDNVWPLVAGLAGGALIGSMMANGGVNNYARTAPPRSSGYYSREDEKKRRNTYTTSYVGSIMNTNRSNVYRATPAGSPALRAATLSTRSTGIWGGSSGGTSARAASHSSSSGG